MNRIVCSGVLIGILCLSAAAAAGTRKISETMYNVGTDPGELITLPNGTKVRTGMEVRANHVDVSGDVRSGWCTQTQHLSASDQPVAGAGYCVIYDDNGDAFWTSFSYKADQPTWTWTVLGGTGHYEGATGSGTTTAGSQRGDGLTWIVKNEGSINTK
jgi:hypothetical protein